MANCIQATGKTNVPRLVGSLRSTSQKFPFSNPMKSEDRREQSDKRDQSLRSSASSLQRSGTRQARFLAIQREAWQESAFTSIRSPRNGAGRAPVNPINDIRPLRQREREREGKGTAHRRVIKSCRRRSRRWTVASSNKTLPMEPFAISGPTRTRCSRLRFDVPAYF